MKRIGMLFGFILCLAGATIAQRNNIAPEIQAGRDMVAIERKTVSENTDIEAVKLIKEHTAAKRKMDATMKKLSGYGKAATDKASIAKFREKNAKKDLAFKTLSDNEIKARIAKEEYMSGANEAYKKHRTISK